IIMDSQNNECEDNHLNEQQLVDYISHDIEQPELQMVNAHLVDCEDCAKQLSLLIMFSHQNNLSAQEGEPSTDEVINSQKYKEMKQSILDRVINYCKQIGRSSKM